jgi:hypothetical protein
MKNIASETATRLPDGARRSCTSSLSGETTVASIRNISYITSGM